MIVSFDDAQMKAIMVAARSLRPSQRDRFLKIISWQVRSEIDVHGAIQRVLRVLAQQTEQADRVA